MTDLIVLCLLCRDILKDSTLQDHVLLFLVLRSTKDTSHLTDLPLYFIKGPTIFTRRSTITTNVPTYINDLSTLTRDF